MELDEELDRKFGTILAAFVGDSLGAYLECRKGEISKEEVEKGMAMTGAWDGKLSPGQVTDDSEMSMCLMRGLVEGNGKMDLKPICKYYGTWVKDNIGIGSTTRQCLPHCKPDNPEPNKVYAFTSSEKCRGATSISNGSMMRVTPLAIWCSKLSNEEIEQAVKADASFTHSLPLVHNVITTYCIGIKYLIQNPKEENRA